MFLRVLLFLLQGQWKASSELRRVIPAHSSQDIRYPIALTTGAHRMLIAHRPSSKPIDYWSEPPVFPEYSSKPCDHWDSSDRSEAMWLSTKAIICFCSTIMSYLSSGTRKWPFCTSATLSLEFGAHIPSNQANRNWCSQSTKQNRGRIGTLPPSNLCWQPRMPLSRFRFGRWEPVHAICNGPDYASLWTVWLL